MMAGDGVIPPIQQLIHVLHPSKLSAPPPCLPANVFEVNGNVAKLFCKISIKIAGKWSKQLQQQYDKICII